MHGPPDTQSSTPTFDVYARENSLATSTHHASSLDTGIDFSTGDALHITASGLWNGGACADIGPEATNCFGNGLPGINHFSLIGRVGGGNFFKIGSSYDGLADDSGTLILAYLDADSSNNTGFVTAGMSLPAVPERETFVLLLGGLVARKQPAPGSLSGRKHAPTSSRPMDPLQATERGSGLATGRSG